MLDATQLQSMLFQGLADQQKERRATERGKQRERELKNYYGTLTNPNASKSQKAQAYAGASAIGGNPPASLLDEKPDLSGWMTMRGVPADSPYRTLQEDMPTGLLVQMINSDFPPSDDLDMEVAESYKAGIMDENIIPQKKYLAFLKLTKGWSVDARMKELSKLTGGKMGQDGTVSEWQQKAYRVNQIARDEKGNFRNWEEFNPSEHAELAILGINKEDYTGAKDSGYNINTFLSVAKSLEIGGDFVSRIGKSEQRWLMGVAADNEDDAKIDQMQFPFFEANYFKTGKPRPAYTNSAIEQFGNLNKNFYGTKSMKEFMEWYEGEGKTDPQRELLLYQARQYFGGK